MDKILVANRGEIAARIIRTARAQGYRTVAVYSQADVGAPHVDLADEAVCIGPAPVAQSYLNISALLQAAEVTGADAVHPGYGFLSENPDFAIACVAAGLTFIGPSADAMALMGSKRQAKLAMIAAGVPCVPGYEGADQSDATLLAEAARIGLPLMVKASAGGGGRGMRLVTSPGDLPAALQSARSEAQSAFGSDELILERAVQDPRHVEVQIFADALGNVIHLGERECSVQRRHQKVIEESPSPAVTPDLRAAMGAAAVQAARACGYVGAGTVEFLLGADGAFYFLEMNTRLQVEHPVTEAVTGLDLVAWQLLVAEGAPLPLTQDQVRLDGWAIEARVYAEDPSAGFVPQTGRVLRWDVPQGPGLRGDDGIRPGQDIGPHYDPMLAKIIAHGPDRATARRRLATALEDTVLLGVASNIRFLARVLRHPVFAGGHATTAFLDRDFAGDASLTPGDPDLATLGLAGALMMAEGPSLGSGRWPFVLGCDGQDHRVTLWKTGPDCVVEGGGESAGFTLAEVTPTHALVIADGVRRRVAYARSGAELWLDTPTGARGFANVTHRPAQATAAQGSGRITAPMDGAILRVDVAIGDRVTQGQRLAVLEAMKMEHPLVADMAGIVAELPVAPGDQVKIRHLVAVLRPDGEGEAV